MSNHEQIALDEAYAVAVAQKKAGWPSQAFEAGYKAALAAAQAENAALKAERDKLTCRVQDLKIEKSHIEAERDAANALLAEAVKVLEPLARAADIFDCFKIVNGEEWFAYVSVQSATGSKGAITVADLRAARSLKEKIDAR